jgi:hypothetical protein
VGSLAGSNNDKIPQDPGKGCRIHFLIGDRILSSSSSSSPHIGGFQPLSIPQQRHDQLDMLIELYLFGDNYGWLSLCATDNHKI